MKMPTLLRCALLLSLSSPLLAGHPAKVRVVALFTDKAMLEINNTQRLLTKGQTSPEGIQLIEANASRALVIMDGQTLSLSPETRVSTNLAVPESREFRIIKDKSGHFRSQGQINGQNITFLVDTGATSVAINEVQAQRLGINYKSAQSGRVQTAAGIVKGYAIKLDQVSLGPLNIRNVPATVLEGNAGTEALMGMSFLKNLEVHQESNLMLLKQKYP